MFIPSLNAKRKYMEHIKDSNIDIRKDDGRLEFINDSFPVSENDQELPVRFWRKYENDNKTFYLINSQTKEFDKDLFFRVMNGEMPDPKTTRIRKDE